MTTVEYSVEVTINLGNFENIKPGFRVIDEVREDETVADAARRVKKLTKKLMEEEVAEIAAEKNGK